MVISSNKRAKDYDDIKPLIELCKAGKLFDVQAWIAAGKPVNSPPPPDKGARRKCLLQVAVDMMWCSAKAYQDAEKADPKDKLTLEANALLMLECEQWLNEENDWVYPLLHRCEDQMAELAGQLASGSAGARLRAGRFAKAPADALTRRALNQAARELMLAQSSDWAFQMSVGSAREYAVKRTRGHVEAFQRLYGEITAGALDEAWLAGVERRDAIFQEMDYTVFA